MRARSVSTRKLVPFASAPLSALAGTIHLVVAPQHAHDGVLVSMAFITVGLAQLAWAFLSLVAPARAAVTTGVAIHGAALVAWLVSRTTGLPFGPHAGVPEAIGSLDATVLVAQVAVLALLACLPDRSPTAASLPDLDLLGGGRELAAPFSTCSVRQPKANSGGRATTTVAAQRAKIGR